MKNMTSFSRTTTLALGTFLLSYLPVTANAYTIAQSGITVAGNVGSSSLYTVSDVLAGEAFKLDWSLEKGSDQPALSAKATVKVTGLTTTQLDLKVHLKNTTSRFTEENKVDLRTGIVMFGLDVDGFSSGSLSQSGGKLDNFSVGGIAGISNQFCASTHTSCTSASQGINSGRSDIFTFSINGNFDPIAGVDLKNFGTKWQTNYQDIVLNASKLNDKVPKRYNYELSATPSPLEIPEPSMISSLVLVGIGILMGVGRQFPR